MRATSKRRDCSGRPCEMKQIFAVVPPMSNESTSSSPVSRAMPAERIAPPAGPDSISRTG